MSFEAFNVVEGIFWIGCALLSLFAIGRVRVMSPLFWKLASADLLLFGISDFVEAMYGESFLMPGGEWLLVWKAACVLGLVSLLGYYLWILKV